MDDWTKWAIGGLTTIGGSLLGLLSAKVDRETGKKMDKNVFREFKDSYKQDQRDQKEWNKETKSTLSNIYQKLEDISNRR